MASIDTQKLQAAETLCGQKARRFRVARLDDMQD
jgi:hypothetical protein